MICGNCFREIKVKGVCPRCGFDTAEAEARYPFALKAGSILNGRYIVGRVLGQGGFGITYIAQDDKTKALVAIKEYYPSEFAARAYASCAVDPVSGDRRENFEFGKQKFLDEAKTLAAFLGDEHIVRIHSYFEENGTAYFAMEYVEGQPLDKYMKDHGGRLTPEGANELLLPLMGALEEVHAKGIVHRDIAPDNIIVQPDGTAKLIDFGAARYSTGEKSKSLDIVIKHGFAPKEQYLRRGRQGPFTDVYAMAATYYYAITGRIPPEAIERMDEDELIPPANLGVKLSDRAEAALYKALAVSAPDRFQTMGEFASALRDPETERRAREAAERRAAEAAEKARREEEQRRAEAERLVREEAERRAAEAAEKARREEERLRAEAEKKAREEERLAAKAAEKERKERERTDRKASAGTDKKGMPKWIFAAIPVVLLAIILPIALKGAKNAPTSDAAAVAQNASETVDASVTEAVKSYDLATFGETVFFGHYEQDNDLTNGSEPIEWFVLAKEESRLLVISKYALDSQKYNEKDEKVTWETCTLRTWLNETFMNNAFSAEEQALISLATVSPDKNQEYNTDLGNSTSDRIFLLSMNEASTCFPDDEARKCEPTAHALAQGAYKFEDGFCWWWLRSPGIVKNSSTLVTDNGYVEDLGDRVDFGYYAVRPALWVEASAVSQTDEQAEPEGPATVSLAEASVGDYVVFGTYEQDNDQKNGKEPIEWLVLDKQDNRILVISRYALDCQRYNTIYNGVNWGTCSLRTWLKKDFLENALTKEEKAMVPKVTVKADPNPNYSTSPGNNVTDQVFLLSIQEAEQYFESDMARACELTPYAKAQGFTVGNAGFWWLRSPGCDRVSAAYVSRDGAISKHGDSVSQNGHVVRPAMWIDVPAGTQTTEQPEPEKTATAPLSSAAVGDYVVFGTYEQDNDTSNGAEPIEWQVLDKQDNRILVTSKYVLDGRPFHNKEEITWEKSNLRVWLNNKFLYDSFTTKERTMIKEVTVTNSDKDTIDRVFLLSIPEMELFFDSPEATRCEPTKYAKSGGVAGDSGTFCCWWLRSPIGTGNRIARINTDGSIVDYGYSVDFKYGVRPAMWITVG